MTTLYGEHRRETDLLRPDPHLLYSPILAPHRHFQGRRRRYLRPLLNILPPQSSHLTAENKQVKVCHLWNAVVFQDVSTCAFQYLLSSRSAAALESSYLQQSFGKTDFTTANFQVKASNTKSPQIVTLLSDAQFNQQRTIKQRTICSTTLHNALNP